MINSLGILKKHRRIFAALFVTGVLAVICSLLWPITFINVFAKNLVIGSTKENFKLNFEVTDSFLYFPVQDELNNRIGWASWDTGAPFNYLNDDFSSLFSRTFMKEIGWIAVGEYGLELRPLVQVDRIDTAEFPIEKVPFNRHSFSKDPRFSVEPDLFDKHTVSWNQSGSFPYLYYLGLRAFGEGVFSINFSEMAVGKVPEVPGDFFEVTQNPNRFTATRLLLSGDINGKNHTMIFDTGSTINVIRQDSDILKDSTQLIYRNPRTAKEDRFAILSMKIGEEEGLFLFQVGSYLSQFLEENQVIFGLNAISRWDWIYELPSARVWKSPRVIKSKLKVEYNLLNRFLG